VLGHEHFTLLIGLGLGGLAIHYWFSLPGVPCRIFVLVLAPRVWDLWVLNTLTSWTSGWTPVCSWVLDLQMDYWQGLVCSFVGFSFFLSLGP
jgi:hypothetical protein